MVTTAVVQVEVLVKAPLLVNLEKPLGTYMPVEVLGFTCLHKAPVALVVVVIPV